MSDLISRLSLKDRASEYALSADEYLRFCEIIDAEPTAYDIDKVVEQLEEQKSGLTEWAEDEAFKLATNNAIEIVKQGSVSDDVCEWKCDEYGRYHTKCHTLADNDPLEYTYCPYCGKNIKVVE